MSYMRCHESMHIVEILNILGNSTYDVVANCAFLFIKVAELENELQKQKELRALYRLKLERTQDYLRYCLQMAQDNGFLDLLINIKESQQECLLPSSTTSPPMPPLMKHRSDLAPLIDQAKMNGWHIEPHEVGLVTYLS